MTRALYENQNNCLRQTSRTQQHTRNMDEKEVKTAPDRHAIERKYNFNLEDVEIIDKERNTTKLIKRKIYTIQNRQKILNKKTEIKHLPNIFINILEGGN